MTVRDRRPTGHTALAAVGHVASRARARTHHREGKVMKSHVGIAIAALTLCLLPVSARAGAVPSVNTVHFSQIGPNMHIEVDGSGFGLAPTTLPAVGILNQFTFTDASQGGWCAGKYGCAMPLQYTSWSDSRIVVDGFGTQYGTPNKVVAGDQVRVFVQNTAAGGGTTTWSGTLDASAPPPLDPGGPTPRVATVQFSRIGPNMHIDIEGAGFGAAPTTLPAVGILNQFTFSDTTQGGWCAGKYGCAMPLQYTSWTDGRIVIDGFGTQYGANKV